MRFLRHRAQRGGGSLCPLAASVSLVYVLLLMAIVGVISRRSLPDKTMDRRYDVRGRTVSRPTFEDGPLFSKLEPERPPRKSTPKDEEGDGRPQSQQVSTSVYYAGKYWNDIPAVRTEVFYKKASGDPSVRWDDHLLRIRGGRPFKRALVFNAGSGWVERELMDKGIILSAVGTDFLQSFIDEANAAAVNGRYNASYVRVDINAEALPAGPFDLVLNYAAAHHIARLDNVFLQINRLLAEDGLFVSVDYVGPHRNQYPDPLWVKLKQVNARLPHQLRQDMAYPHLPTMLATDPSEAHHSELIMPTLRRYFFVDLFRPLGGAVAYPLLTHNKALHAVPYEETRDAVAMVMDEDDRWLADDEGRTFFAFIVARPLRGGLPDGTYQAKLLRHEADRESAGTRSTYFTPTKASMDVN